MFDSFIIFIPTKNQYFSLSTSTTKSRIKPYVLQTDKNASCFCDTVSVETKNKRGYFGKPRYCKSCKAYKVNNKEI